MVPFRQIDPFHASLRDGLMKVASFQPTQESSCAAGQCSISPYPLERLYSLRGVAHVEHMVTFHRDSALSHRCQRLTQPRFTKDRTCTAECIDDILKKAGSEQR